MAEMKTNCVVVADDKKISIFASLLRGAYRAVGAKRHLVCRKKRLKRLLRSKTAIVEFLLRPTARHIMKQLQ